jgi:hypothetical protein
VFFTLLAMGRYSPIPLREWLAEYFFVYRVGRAPAGQHRGFALFCLALASAAVFDRLWHHASPRVRTILVALVAADFAFVTSVNSHVRYGVLPDDLQGTVARFRISAMQAYDSAFQYAQSRGLRYPMKSSVYRAMLAGANARAAATPLIAANLAIGQGLIAEARAFTSGACR